MPNINSLGRHLIAEFYGCNENLLSEVESVKNAMEKAATDANATIVNVTFHHFAPFGVSGVVVIQESHLAIHTWPEYQYASVDIYTCGDSVDPWVALSSLEKLFQSEKISCVELSRGQLSQLPEPSKLLKNLTKIVQQETISSFTEDVWFTERAQHLALSVRHSGGLLFKEQSRFQKIEVYQTHLFGRMLVLDGSIAFTQQDENAYHEMLVHVPLLSHPKPARVLVIGGGDGGAIRELLKHEEVEEITLVELDEKVTEVCKTYFPTLKEAFESDRLKIVYQDGSYFLANCEEAYDIIIVDTNNPLHSGETPMLSSFYRGVQRVLHEEGILVTPIGSPSVNQAIFRQNFYMLKDTFSNKRVNHYLAFIPSYLTGMWSFAIVESKFFKNVERQKDFLAKNELNYYNLAIHNSSFHHPNFVKKILQ